MPESLQEKIKSFPNSPGVYQFFGKTGEILYIGKAKNLRNRVHSYFLKEIGRGPGIDNMVKLASDIRYIETESEIEALLLESELVNRILPKYNIRLRDDKSFLVIKITKKIQKSKIKDQAYLAKAPQGKNSTRLPDGQVRQPADKINNLKKNNKEVYDLFPKVELARYRNADLKDKSAEYFGPYPSGELLKKSIRYLRKIFPFRDCSKTKFNTYRRKGRPCIYGDIRVCTAPCVEWIGEDEYQKNILYLKNFVRGRKKEIERKLTLEMNALSRQKQFERAALVRDKLNALGHLKDVAVGIRDDSFDSSKILFKRIECYDISNIGGEYGVGSMVVFSNFKADKNEYRRFKIKSFEGANDLLAMREVLIRRFKNDWPLPDLLVIDGGANHLNVAKEVARALKLQTPIVSIAKGPERKKNELHFSDASIARYVKENKELENVLISARDEAHCFAITYYRKLHRKDMFE